MLLPHLELLNLSNNQIANIEPVANILSKNLYDIYLQHNQIENIKPLLNAKFSIESLEVLRIDNNKFSIDKNPDIQKLLQIYKEKIIYEIKDWSSFNEKYNSNITKNDTKLDLGSRRNNNIIIDLFPLVVYPNDIKILILDNNKIQDASLLGKMPLYNLETLDLSLNLISSIIFLKKLSTKCKNLKILYLHENKINDISPLYTYKYNEKEGNEGKNDNEEKKNKEENGQSCLAFEKLETLTLKNNSLDLEDKATKDIFKTFLKNNNLTIDYKEDEIPPDKKSESDKDEKSKKHTGEVGMLPAQLAMI
jgi:Leucine-rich repeat (LRR) protein